MIAADFIREIHALIADPASYTSFPRARRASGHTCPAESPEAVRWSLFGAIVAVAFRHGEPWPRTAPWDADPFGLAVTALNDAAARLGYDSAWTAGGNGHAPALAVCDLAAQLVDAQVAAP